MTTRLVKYVHSYIAKHNTTVTDLQSTLHNLHLILVVFEKMLYLLYKWKYAYA